MIPAQNLYEGPGLSARAAEILKRANGTKALIVTDATLVKLGVLKTMLDAMDAVGFPYVIFDGVEPNPSIENIDKAVQPGSDLTARQNLSKAAYCGGQSLNTATTGYVHPFCHKIGAKYGLVHGRCIGAVLPIMLDVYGEKTEKRVAKLGVATGISDPAASQKTQAAQFIKALRDFDEKFGIQANIPEIEEKDFDEIADSIMVENFVYPTKVIFSREEIFSVLRKIKG